MLTTLQRWKLKLEQVEQELKVNYTESLEAQREQLEEAIADLQLWEEAKKQKPALSVQPL
jgi:hypothetical protein